MAASEQTSPITKPLPPPSERPLSGLFAINKPSGPTTMYFLESLKSLFLSSTLFVEYPEALANQKNKSQKPNQRQRKKKRRLEQQFVKMGQGGTLDPLASGVVVIGLNSATKKLGSFINCTKSYRAVGLLGCETDSYDSAGKVIRLVDWKSVKPDDVKNLCRLLKGPHWQVPPIYSALKMDGKPMYEYARKNIPLPRPIEARPCEIFDLEMIDWQEGGSNPMAHSYKWPTEMLSAEDRQTMEKTSRLIEEKGIVKGQSQTEKQPTPSSPSETVKRALSSDPGAEEPDHKRMKNTDVDQNSILSSIGLPVSDEKSQIDQITMDDNGLSPAFTLEMTVSSGTYVRTIVHDIGKAVGSAATVVSLIRTRQGDFALEPKSRDDVDRNRCECIEWEVFERAIQLQKDGLEDPCSELDGLREWERVLLKHIQL